MIISQIERTGDSSSTEDFMHEVTFSSQELTRWKIPEKTKISDGFRRRSFYKTLKEFSMIQLARYHFCVVASVLLYFSNVIIYGVEMYFLFAICAGAFGMYIPASITEDVIFHSSKKIFAFFRL